MPNGNIAFELEQNALLMRDLNTYAKPPAIILSDVD